MLAACEQQGMAFIPHSPNILGPSVPYGSAGTMERPPTPAEALVAEIGAAHDVSAQQVAVTWLLSHSAVTVPIPGTSKVEHVDDNVAAAGLRLGEEELRRLDALDPA